MHVVFFTLCTCKMRPIVIPKPSMFTTWIFGDSLELYYLSVECTTADRNSRCVCYELILAEVAVYSLQTGNFYTSFQHTHKNFL